MELVFSMGDVERALMAPKATIQTWIRRADLVIPSNEYQGGGGAGNHRRFSLPALMHMAMGAELVRLGMSPAVAFAAAARFAYRANMDGDKIVRRCGLPFHWQIGQTLFVVPSGQPEKADAVASKDGTLALWEVPGMAKSFAVIDAGDLFDRTAKALNIDPVQYLNTAYD
jgi:hypothetical protein